MKSKHTPTPWKIVPIWEAFIVEGKKKEKLFFQVGNYDVPACSKTNAAFIVQACNSHEELLEASKRALKEILELTDAQPVYRPNYLIQAIAKAEGK